MNSDVKENLKMVDDEIELQDANNGHQPDNSTPLLRSDSLG